MRLMRNLLLLLLLVMGGYYFLEQNNISPEETIDDFSKVLKQKKNMLETKEVPEGKQESIPLEGDFFHWAGKTSDELAEELGEPVRKDLSAYGYTWWVYTDQMNQYIQFGIDDDEIKTIFASGNNLPTEPIQMGESYDVVNEQVAFKDEVTYSEGISSYTFRLNDEDLRMRPLAKIQDDLFIQYYFDTFTNELSSIRILTADVLLQHRPYEVEYRGDLPEPTELSDEQWAKVESGMEQQIFDLTNVMRNQHEKSGLEREKSVGEVAFSHSKDMSDNNYFSHYGLDGSGLKERLAAEEIHYLAAGENIAAQYTDAPAAMIGWLNSEGHREALFNDDYTHLGVGVYRFYYTQNFLSK